MGNRWQEIDPQILRGGGRVEKGSIYPSPVFFFIKGFLISNLGGCLSPPPRNWFKRNSIGRAGGTRRAAGIIPPR